MKGILDEDNDWFNDLFADDSPPKDVLFDSQVHLAFLIIIFIILFVFIIWLVSRFFISEAYAGKWIHYIPLIFTLLVTIFLLLLLITNKLHVQIIQGGDETGVLFSLALAIMIMPYANAVLTGSFKIESRLALYTLFAVIIYFSVTNLGQIGVRVTFNIDLDLAFVFAHKTFQSNSADGIKFITENVGLWLAIFAGSFAIEMFS